MKSYIVQIVGTALLAVFADILSPTGWKKYTGIITGMIMIVVIISPFSKWRDVNILPEYQIENEEVVSRGNEIYSDMIKYEFSKTVANDVRERIKQEFSKDVLVEVSVEISDSGNIEKISKIKIQGDDIDEGIAKRMSEVYNVSEVILDVA